MLKPPSFCPLLQAMRFFFNAPPNFGRMWGLFAAAVVLSIMIETAMGWNWGIGVLWLMFYLLGRWLDIRDYRRKWQI